MGFIIRRRKGLGPKRKKMSFVQRLMNRKKARKGMRKLRMRRGQV
jgi:hypothetical protein